MKTLFICCLVMVSVSGATTVELAPIQDAYICCCQPDVTNPNGGENFLYHGQYGSCFDRTLIQWDLTTLPTGITVTSAKMMLYCEAFYGTQSGCPIYYMINSIWDEQTVTYNTQPDYELSQSINGIWPGADTWYEVDVTSFAVQWVEGTHQNYGIYCFCEGTTGTCVPGFWSSNYPDSSLHPRLVIEYQELGLDDTTWGTLKSLQSSQ